MSSALPHGAPPSPPIHESNVDWLSLCLHGEFAKHDDSEIKGLFGVREVDPQIKLTVTRDKDIGELLNLLVCCSWLFFVSKNVLKMYCFEKIAFKRYRIFFLILILPSFCLLYMSSVRCAWTRGVLRSHFRMRQDRLVRNLIIVCYEIIEKIGTVCNLFFAVCQMHSDSFSRASKTKSSHRINRSSRRRAPTVTRWFALDQMPIIFF